MSSLGQGQNKLAREVLPWRLVWSYKKEEKKMQHIYTMEYYSTFKMKAVLSFATTWVNLKDMLSEISLTQKDRCHMISLLCET